MRILASLPSHSRVWVYTSNREFTPTEVEQITSMGNEFAGGWQVHGKPLKAAFEVVYNRFLVFGVDEQVAGASGCSIDSSVRLMKTIEQEFNAVLLDKLNLAFHGSQNTVEVLPMFEFQKEIDNGGIHSETIVFNNLVETVEELNKSWEIPLNKSWHNQLL